MELNSSVPVDCYTCLVSIILLQNKIVACLREPRFNAATLSMGFWKRNCTASVSHSMRISLVWCICPLSSTTLLKYWEITKIWTAVFVASITESHTPNYYSVSTVPNFFPVWWRKYTYQYYNSARPIFKVKWPMTLRDVDEYFLSHVTVCSLV
jgi:hypothetical protein